MAKQCGLSLDEMPWLHEYVKEDGGREAFSNRVAYDYGVEPRPVKQLVNLVCNGGAGSTYAHEVGARAEMLGVETSDVDAMRDEVKKVREVLAGASSSEWNTTRCA